MRKYSFAILFLIIILGGFLRLYKLNDEAFARDEFFDINTSYGYFKTGEWLAWDFNMDQPLEPALQKDYSNTRAQFFRIPLALAYNIMEPTEGNARLMSVFWGIVSIIAIYFVTLSFTGNFYVALLAAFLTAICESEIIFGRRLRMYSMLFPIYLIFSWCLFKFYESAYKGKIIFFQKIYQKFKVNPSFILPTALFGFVSYEIQELSVHIAFSLIVYCLFLAVFSWKKEKNIFLNKYLLTILGAIVGVIFLKMFLGGAYKDFDKAVSFWQDNYRSVNYFFTDFRYLTVGVVLFFLGGWFLAFKLERKKEALFIFLSASVPLFYAVFSWVREPASRYIYFIQSFGLILSAVGIYAVYYFLVEKFKNYKKIIALIVLVLTLLSLDYSHIIGKDSLYQQRQTSNFIDFRKVFAVVEDNLKPGDILVTRAYRSFYFSDWKIKTYDVKALPLEKQNCQETFAKIISENENGMVVLPEIDHLSVCKNGRKYLEENLEKIDSQVSGVNIYRWDKKEFRMTIASDLHAGNEFLENEKYDPRNWKKKLDYLVSQSNDSEFIIMLGDSQQRPNDEIFNLLKDYEEKSKNKFIWVNGNHDGDMHLSGQKYYYIDYNNWRMIILYNLKTSADGFEYECVKIDDEQMRWLENILKTNKNKIVFIHCPVFSEKGRELRNRYVPLVDLLDKYNVKYVYSGHEHPWDFEERIKGIIFRAVPQLDTNEKFYKILKLE